MLQIGNWNSIILGSKHERIIFILLKISTHFTSCCRAVLNWNMLPTLEVTCKIPKDTLNYLLTNPSVLSIFSPFAFLYKKKEAKCSHDLVKLRKKLCLWFVSIIKVKLNHLSLPQSLFLTWKKASQF